MITYDENIDALEARIARLEAFILRDQQNYSPVDLLLERESLESVIRSTVEDDFYITTTTTLQKNWEEPDVWVAEASAALLGSK
jgi:hypothetical protein